MMVCLDHLSTGVSVCTGGVSLAGWGVAGCFVRVTGAEDGFSGGTDSLSRVAGIAGATVYCSVLNLYYPEPCTGLFQICSSQSAGCILISLSLLVLGLGHTLCCTYWKNSCVKITPFLLDLTKLLHWCGCGCSTAIGLGGSCSLTP